MISDSIQTPDDKSKETMALTRSKRDEFLVEIRKKKSQNLVNEKRFKVSHGEVNLEANPFMIKTDFQNDHFEHLVPNDTYSSQARSEYEAQLKMASDKFHELLNQRNWDELIQVIQSLREAVGSNQSWVSGKTIIEMGIIPSVLFLLTGQFRELIKLQVEAAWLIANVSAGDAQDNACLVEQNCIEVLLECLKAKNEDLQENALWSLANITTERNIDFRGLVIEAGVLKEVVKQLCRTPKKISYSRTAAWLFSNLLRKPSPSFDQVSVCASALPQLIALPDEETQRMVLACLADFSSLEDNARFYVISSNRLIPKIVKFIGHENPQMSLYALKTAGNLSYGDAKITLQLCQSDILQTLASVLANKDAQLRKEACYTLSNILADKSGDHDFVVENRLLPLLLEIMAEDNVEIKYEATVCIYNFVYRCSVSEGQVLVSKGALEILVQNLMEDSVKLIIKSLHTLSKLLELGEQLKENYDGVNPYTWRIANGNGANIIESLQTHKDEDIYHEVSRLIDNFFTTEVAP